jgi:hypothetical protein
MVTKKLLIAKPTPVAYTEEGAFELLEDADIAGRIHELFKQLPDSPLQRFMALWFTYNEKDIPEQMYTKSDMMDSYYAGVNAGKCVADSISFPEFIKKMR